MQIYEGEAGHCFKHSERLEASNYGRLCRTCNIGVPGIEWPVIDSTEEAPPREPTEGTEKPGTHHGYGAGPERDAEGTTDYCPCVATVRDGRFDPCPMCGLPVRYFNESATTTL